jgi:hypothetical protein
LLKIVIGRASGQLIRKALEQPRRPDSKLSSVSNLPPIAHIASEEIPCPNGDCKISPPKRYVERIVEPTPEPIVQKIVSRLPTPEPSIIEVKFFNIFNCLFDEIFKNNFKIIIKKPCPNKENLVTSRPPTAQSLLRRSNSLVSERKHLIPPPPLPENIPCQNGDCKISPPKRYVERIVEPTPEPIGN